jgi:hypothetical protein
MPASVSARTGGRILLVSLAVGAMSPSDLAMGADAVKPPSHFYSPSGNIECTLHEGFRHDEVVCTTFNNHRAVGVTDNGLLWTSPTNTYSSSFPIRFHPGGRTPVLAYDSKWVLRWRGGSFTCTSATTGMTCLARGVRLAGFTINRDGIKRLPAPAATSSTPDYITADSMEATFEENGIDVRAAHYTWLQVGCLGQGQPRGTALDRNGVPEDRYHLFECNGTLSSGKTALVHVEIYTSPGHPDRFRYRYQIISIF